MMNGIQFPGGCRLDTLPGPRPRALIGRLLPVPVTRMPRGAAAGGLLAVVLGLLVFGAPAAQASQAPPQAGLPAHAAAASGYEVAFQANTGMLWVVRNGVGQNLGLGMKAGTSPAITALPGGGYEAAFQANTGDLWVVGNGVGQDLGLGMKAGTSPAITALPGGGYEVAFQANTGNLWVVRNGVGAGPGPGHEDRHQPGDHRRCPAAATRSRSRPTPATCGPSATAVGHELGLGMMAGTSPAITALSGGGYEVAFQANTGELWTVGSAGSTRTWAWA